MKITHTNTTISRIVTLFMIGSFFVATWYSHGISILPVDSMMQQAYLRSQQEDFSALTKSLTKWGNIYDQAYALAKKNTLGSITEAFSSVSDNLNAQYNCSLTASDISVVIASDPILNASLAGYTGKPNFVIDNDQLVRSCVRIAQCAKGQEFKEFQVSENYSQEAYTYCRQIASQAFNNTISITAKKNTIDAANRGDDMFYNGSLDDSPFDLLLDMQMIGDVLFKSNTAAPQVILYDFPWVGWAGSSPTYFNPNGASSSPNAAISFGGVGWSNTSVNSTVNQTNSTITPNSPASNSQNISLASTQALDQLVTYNRSTQTATSTTNTAAATTTTTSNNLLCIAPSQVTAPLASPEQIRANQIVEAQNFVAAVQTYNQAINGPQALAQTLTSPALQNNSSTSTAVANLGGSANQGNAGNSNNSSNPNNAANSCIAKCDWLAPADKVACQAKCLCETKYSDNGIFGISVCTVPTAQTEVIGGKSVKTVEEIVDEINNVLTALKNSWQLMKHTKSKEFLDTSLSKIKLNQILSFDMNIAFKPIYDSHVNQEKKESKKSQEQAIADRARQGIYTDGGIGQERNKYVVLTNPIRQQLAATDLSVQSSPSPTTSIDNAFPYTIAKTLNNDMINVISSFMEQNAILWQQVSETMNAINTTAGNLEKKIQRGN